MRKYPVITWAMFSIAAIIAIVLFVALISLEQYDAAAETMDAEAAYEGSITIEDNEYQECVNALYRAFYSIPNEWAEALAKYLDPLEPFDISAEKPEPRILEVANLSFPEYDPEAALYWFIASDKYGSLEYGSVFSYKDGYMLAWPVVDAEKEGDEFVSIISGMQPGEIWEFIAYRAPFGVLKYVVLATPDIYNIKALRLRLYDLTSGDQ